MEQLYEESLQQGQIVLPIHKIEDLRVSVILQSDVYSKFDMSVYLQIWSLGVKLFEDKSSNYQEFRQMVNSIQHLKFSVLHGKFYTTFPPDYSPLFEFSNVQLTSSECCVCFERTETKTGCDHPLCWICYTKIPSYCCLMCRQAM